ncbi:MAG TPA: ABC transporter permease [Dokdonella sp.]
MKRWLDDLRVALRSLLARPLFFLTAVATLALGLCALAAIFTVYDAVLLKPLPYAQADRIVRVTREQPPISEGPVARPVLQEWRERSADVFDAFGGYNATTMNLTGAGDAERLTASAVTPGFWQVFGHPIALGRAFGDEEENHDERVVVLSNALWRNRFGAAADIVGRAVVLNGESYRVVGVTAADFAYPMLTQIWLPTWLPSSNSGRGTNYLDVVARLRDGASIAAARQTLATVTSWEAKTWPDNHAGLEAEVEPLQQSLTGRFDQPLTMLLLASALVLLIACANLAGLMLARGQTREREFAVRRALGADRASLVRSVLAEAIAIAVAGALIGILAAQPTVRALMTLAPGLLPSAASPTVDIRVIAIVVLAALAALVIAGLAPAWRATRADPADTLRGGGRDAGGSRAQGRLRGMLVSAEIALAFMLLGGSALLIQSLRHLGDVDTGVRSENVLTASVAIPVPSSLPGEDMLTLLERIKATNGPRIDALLARVAALPGVAHVGLVDSLPISGGGGSNGSFRLAGQAIPDDQALVEFRFVSPDYFQALGIALLHGRVFDAHDGSEAGLGTRVLVNQAFVDHFLAGKDAIGQQFSQVLDDTPKTIVGVVGNARQFGLERVAQPEVYFPVRAYPNGDLSIAVRVDGDALAFAEPLRHALKELAPDVPVFSVRTMDEATRTTMAMRRFNLTLMSVFAGIALALAAIGLYGVIACSVGQRRREIGLRQAIGASAFDIHRLVLGSGLRMVAPGMGIGVVGAFALGRLIAAQLYGVGAADPFVLGAVVLALTLVAFCACAIPTLRAARVAPMEALRNE